MLKIAPFAAIVVVIASLSFMLSAACKKTKSVQITDLEKHPVYKNYKFSDDEKVIEIGVPTPWSTVNHIVEVMKRDEAFKRELKKIGYTVRFYPFMKGPDVNYFMKKGLIEGSIIGDMPTLEIASEGHVKVMTVFHKGSVSLVSRDIYRAKDLKGKRVAYPYGSIAHYYLLRLLTEEGLSENDIRHMPMDAKDILDAIRNNKIDAFTSFEPTATIFTKIDPTLHTIHRSFSSYGFFNIRKDYGERHKDAVKAIIAAQIRAVKWLRKSVRNLDMASMWMAEESMKIVPLPLNKYIKELTAISSEDLNELIAVGCPIVGAMNVYSKVACEFTFMEGGDINKEFEFLKMKGFISKDKKPEDIIKYFDRQTAIDVAKNMKISSAEIIE
ncbi:MAG: NrtA/SsuA/CpmA family ABC transporter substrate-binding protein [Nitrospirae bacterium]|nr:NrtA/SsuA/CpmA family ABC transporter substrate-binding protein [Nitrospirota bacterium]